jgi:hypothetical protein
MGYVPPHLGVRLQQTDFMRGYNGASPYVNNGN